MVKKLFVILVVLLNTCTKVPKNDFGSLNWGASPDDVIKAEGRKPDGKETDVLIYEKKLSGVPVQLGYIFVGDKLARAAYIPLDAGGMQDKVKQAYLAVTDSLTKVYGASQDSTMDEGARFKKTWHSTNSNIYLYFFKESFLLSFTSKKYEPLIKMDEEGDSEADSTGTEEK